MDITTVFLLRKVQVSDTMIVIFCDDRQKFRQFILMNIITLHVIQGEFNYQHSVNMTRSP